MKKKQEKDLLVLLGGQGGRGKGRENRRQRRQERAQRRQTLEGGQAQKSRTKPRPESEEESFAALAAAAEELEQQLRSLEDLPLSVSTVSCLSSAFRGTAVRPPIRLAPGQTADAVEDVYEMELGLESSGKWPWDEAGIAHCATAFLLEIGNCLKTKFQHPFLAYPERILVLVSGFVFGLQLNRQRLLLLLKRQAQESSAAALRAEALQRSVLERPKLCRLLRGEMGQRGHLAAACRAVKRWLNRQMMGEAMEEEVLECLVASQPPFSSAAEGLRGFLRVLAKQDWVRDLVAVRWWWEESGAESEKALRALRERMREERPRLPLLILFLPGVDEDGCHWTRSRPSAPQLAHLRKLATATLAAPSIENALIAQPTVGHFHLRLLLLPSPRHPLCTSDPLPPIATPKHNPHRLFYQALQAALAGSAALFWDSYGGREIGVILKPTAVRSVSPQASRAWLSELDVDESGREIMRLNLKQLQEDIFLLGKGVLQDIVVQKSPTFS